MKPTLLLFWAGVLTNTALAQQTQSIYYTAATADDGKSNITLGPYAGTTGGTQTVTLGAFAGQYNTALGNVFVGHSSGRLTSSGTANTFVGTSAGYTNTTGPRNSFLGYQAGYANSTGDSNAFIGYQAGYANSSGSVNVFLGAVAGNANTTGGGNAFVGAEAGKSNTTGNYNAFAGAGAGTSNVGGASNTFLGYGAGYYNIDGSLNTFVGNGAGTNTTSSRNTFIGNAAGYTTSTGTNNVFLGAGAGQNNITGSNNTMLGYNSTPTSSNLQNAVAIGYNATVALSNAIVLGDVSNTSIAVGIGTNAPQFPLDVRGTINLRNNGRIKFAHLSNPLRNGTTDQFLTVNEQGETELARYRLRIDNVNQWSDKVFSPTYHLKPLSQVEQHIQQHGHLPDVPSAEQVVKEGIDPAKMDAKLLEKIEELTLYSIQQEKKVEHYKQEVDQLKTLVKQLLEKK
ncbi:hypothetical protein GCM10027592_60800 [Spirosoma flavus]